MSVKRTSKARGRELQGERALIEIVISASGQPLSSYLPLSLFKGALGAAVELIGRRTPTARARLDRDQQGTAGPA